MKEACSILSSVTLGCPSHLRGKRPQAGGRLGPDGMQGALGEDPARPRGSAVSGWFWAAEWLEGAVAAPLMEGMWGLHPVGSGEQALTLNP